MTIRKVTRRGETRLVIDTHYRKPDGTQNRYRKDAQVQSLPRPAPGNAGCSWPEGVPGLDEGTRGGSAMRWHCSGAARPDAGARACVRPSAAHIGLPSVPSTLTALTALTAITTLTRGSGEEAAAA